jgi:hypothetical protein
MSPLTDNPDEWDDLVEFLARGTVKKMRIATEWKAANE